MGAVCLSEIDKIKQIVRDSVYDYYTQQYLNIQRRSISEEIRLQSEAATHNILSYNTGIRSTCLSLVMYDRDAKQLAVTFKDSGRTYVYYGEEYATYEKLISAPSVGRYYNFNIKLR